MRLVKQYTMERSELNPQKRNGVNDALVYLIVDHLHDKYGLIIEREQAEKILQTAAGNSSEENESMEVKGISRRLHRHEMTICIDVRAVLKNISNSSLS